MILSGALFSSEKVKWLNYIIGLGALGMAGYCIFLHFVVGEADDVGAHGIFSRGAKKDEEMGTEEEKQPLKGKEEQPAKDEKPAKKKEALN